MMDDMQDSVGPNLVVRSWYLSLHRLLEIFGNQNIPLHFSHAFADPDHPTAKIILANELGKLILPYLSQEGVVSLRQLLIQDKLRVGVPFVFDGLLCSKGFNQRNKSNIVSLSTRADDLLDGRKLFIHFSTNGLITTTAWGQLSGQNRLFTFASISSMNQKEIHAVPYLIGHLVESFRHSIDVGHFVKMALHVSEIDQFRNIDFRWTPNANEFAALRDVSENEIKRLLCELLGEVTIDKDWGGEERDIYSSNFLIGGNRHTASFLLKGPSKFHEMTLADCGKNGDQIYRLFNTPADVYVVQHCHRISPAVRKTVEAFALTKFTVKSRYLFIDGYDTARILHSCGRLPSTSKPKRQRKQKAGVDDTP